MTSIAVNPPFRIGEVIGQSFQTTTRNLIPFGAFAILAFIVIAVIFLVLSSVFGFSMLAMMPSTMDTGTGVPAFGAGFFIGFLLFITIVTALYWSIVAAFVYATVQDLLGRPVGFASLPTTAISFFLHNLPTIALLIGISLVLQIVSYLLENIPVVGPIVSLVISVFIYVSLWVVIPVAAIERLGAIANLQRSFELTKDNRLKILGILLIVFAIGIAIGIVVVAFMFISPELGMILLGLFLTALAIFGAVLMAVSYYKLRVAKEGVDIDQIAKVFD